MKKSLGAVHLAMPLPVWVIGSYGESGAPCLMTAAWCGICCSEPPCVAVAIRKSRLSHANVLARGAFTVNIPSQQYAAEVDYIGLVSGRKIDKFSVTGLTPIRSELVDAPYIEEFPLIMECLVLSNTDIGTHTLFIGKLADVKGELAVLDANGLPELSKINPFICSPADKYYYEVGLKMGPAYALGRKIRQEPI